MLATRLILMLTVIAIVAASTAGAQQNNKPLTNQDVISMAKNLLPETVIIDAIKTNDTDFDISASELIALKKAAVTSNVMQAMLAAANNKKNAATASAPPASAAPSGVPSAAAALASASGAAIAPTPATIGAPVSAVPAWQPTVSAVQGGSKINLVAEATQIVQSKSKQTSLSALAADQTLNEALKIGTQVAQKALMKSGSAIGVSSLVPGAAILSGLMSQRAKHAKTTYVWALAGGSSTTTSAGENVPTFEVNYAGLPGVNADQFEPVIVKLSPTPQSNFRLVGATEAATTAEQSTQQDWPIYSSFIEDRLAANVQKLGAGHALVTPSAAMLPGEYAVAFRPVDKSKKFAGEDVGKNQGEGLLFNYAWSFSAK